MKYCIINYMAGIVIIFFKDICVVIIIALGFYYMTDNKYIYKILLYYQGGGIGVIKIEIYFIWYVYTIYYLISYNII